MLAAAPKIKVLMIDGQNNHKWQETTPALKAILDETGISKEPEMKPVKERLAAEIPSQWVPHPGKRGQKVSNDPE